MNESERKNDQEVDNEENVFMTTPTTKFDNNENEGRVETVTIHDDGTISSGQPTIFKPADCDTNLLSDKNIKRGTLTNFTVRESATRLIHVEYPGFVENEEKAMRTLGGMARVSDTFADYKRKLELRFRPSDIYCNPVNAEGSTTCGVLIKIRRKKKPMEIDRKKPAGGTNKFYANVDESKLIGLDHTLPEPPPLSHNPAFVHKSKLLASNSVKGFEIVKNPSPIELERAKKKEAILKEEAELLRTLEERILEEDRGAKPNAANAGTEQVFLKLPPIDFRPSRSGLSVEVLGIIHRSYKFKGICDFQYLPTEFDAEEGCQVSVQDSIAPVFGDPDNDILFMADTLEPNEEIPLFLVPSVMSRLDKPLSSVTTFLEDNRGVSDGGDVIRSTRAKRVVYSHNINFRLTDDKLDSNRILVPQKAMPEALSDVKKRLLADQLEDLKKAFIRRPIWTKLGLESEMGIKVSILKYLVPCVAYFCLNGPWRSLWVRFGFDPRKDKSACIYQLLDYRIPHSYRTLITLSKKDPESYFAFKPGEIPPKCQMFYQLCDVHIKEVDAVILALTNRVNSIKNIEYSPKFGFIDEDTLEYCRYCISRYVEIFLKDKDKIPAVTLAELELPPGCTAPRNMVKLGLSRNPTLPFRMRSRPKRKDPPKRLIDRPEGSSSRNSESDASSLVGDLTIKADLFRDNELVSLEDEDEDWQDEVHTPISVTTNDDSYDDDDDPVMQEILGN